MPHLDDCIHILMTPEKYNRQIRKEVGAWFMTPGWAEVGVDMIIKELKLERLVRYGKDPLATAKRLFTHYRRALYVDTGVGNNAYCLRKAHEFCRILNLTLERTTGTSRILERTSGNRRADSEPPENSVQPSSRVSAGAVLRRSSYALVWGSQK